MIEYLVPMGIPVTADQFRIGSSSGLVAWELVKQGFGITPMSDDVAAKCPEVERVLQDAGPITFPIWLTTHRELHTSRRIRLVYDMLAEFFAAK